MTPMKFKVLNTKHSKQIQEWLLNSLFFWPGDFNKPFHTESKFLYTDSDGCISHGNNKELYEKYKGKEMIL